MKEIHEEENNEKIMKQRNKEHSQEMEVKVGDKGKVKKGLTDMKASQCIKCS
jgi:hypothetical protein